MSWSGSPSGILSRDCDGLLVFFDDPLTVRRVYRELAVNDGMFRFVLEALATDGAGNKADRWVCIAAPSSGVRVCIGSHLTLRDHEHALQLVEERYPCPE